MQSKPGGIAARAGRWSARHKKTAILGWLAFVVVALVARQHGRHQGAERRRQLRRRVPRRRDDRRGRRVQRGRRRDGARPEQDPHGQGRRVPRRGQGRRARRCRRSPSSPTSSRPTPRAAQVSEDGHSALVQFDIKGDPDKADGRDRPGDRRRSTRSGAAHRDVTSRQFGGASVDEGARRRRRTAEQSRSQMISLSVTLLILLITFGALLAAAVPVVLALTAVVGTDRSCRHRQPARPHRQRHAAGDPARRPGRRRRLLAVLHPARA